MEQENTAVQALERIQARLKEEAEKRQKQLMRRSVPEKRTLADALAAMTKQELDDIRYNVGLSGMSGLNKADTIEKLVPAIVQFARSWLVSLLDEQYQAFWHLANSGGISTQFRADEVRLDYFQSLGLMASGAHDGKLAWYLPQEILEEFQSLNRNPDFARAVELNTDALRMASGLLFYYGVMDYDALYAKVCRHLEIDKDALPFADFMRVMFNGACWQKNIVAAEKVMFYYAVLDPNRVLDAQARLDVGFAKLSYGQVYDAGEENYIEATDAYKALAQFFMTAGGADVLRAAGIVGQITALLQNGRSMQDALAYIESEAGLTDEAGMEALPKLLIDFHSSLRMWELKGHTPKEIMTGKLDPEGGEILSFAAAQRRRGKAGRNDPCPCGSGKKYKNCCMRKDTGEA